MKVTDDQIQEAVGALRDMGAKRVVLFGSMLNSQEGANDIDLAVEGIPLRQILEADVAVHEILGVSTDLVSREEDPEFYDIIKDYGKTLYE